jgi:hypothetical protein
MTKNADGDSICSRIAGLVAEFEQSRGSDSTEIGRQFAVRNKNMIKSFIFISFVFSLSNYNGP